MSPTLYRPVLAPESSNSFWKIRSVVLLALGLILFAPQWSSGSPVSNIKDPLTVTGNIPTGVATQAYSASVTASGGNAPYTYKAASLPKGLAINNSTGAISGTSNS